MVLLAALVADTVVAYTYTKYALVACNGRNEILASGTGYTLEQCEAVCNAAPACVSIEFGTSSNSGACQASSTCTNAYWSTGASGGNWDVYVKNPPSPFPPPPPPPLPPTPPPLPPPTWLPYAYTRHENVACDGRNEILAGGTGYTLEECQAVCNAAPSCVSIEFGTGDNVGACQASTSCTGTHWSGSAAGGLYDVYTRDVYTEGMAATLAALMARVEMLEQQNRCLQFQVDSDSQICVGSLTKSDLMGLEIRAKYE